jgi:hypothetical protein
VVQSNLIEVGKVVRQSSQPKNAASSLMKMKALAPPRPLPGK